MPVTAKDIARELDLSQPTVSRILSGDSKHRAAPATRRRVLETAQRLGYAPNAVASSLRRGRTDVIGLHTSHDYDVRNDFMGAIVGSLQRACALHNLDVLLHSALSGVPARQMFGKLRDGRVDGLILHAQHDDPLVALLRNSRLPTVVVADPLPKMAAVTSDDEGGMRYLIAHLWGRGYRRFAFVAPHQTPASVARRRDAFMAQLAGRGARGRIVGINYEDVAPALDELLAQIKPNAAIDERLAVCCWNDRTAYNLLRACAERGVEVPQTLAVTGFDGFDDDKLPARRLTTIVCPWDEVAATALDLLRARIEAGHEERPLPAPEEVCLPVRLRAGDTT